MKRKKHHLSEESQPCIVIYQSELEYIAGMAAAIGSTETEGPNGF